MTDTKTLEAQIEELQAQINYLKNGGITVSPSQRLQRIRKECRERYFGTWDEMRNGEIQYGPSGKTWSDYGAIEEIITKTTGLLFKYSYGKPSSAAQITALLKTEEDEQRYKGICEEICQNLREQVDQYFSQAEGRERNEGNHKNQ